MTLEDQTEQLPDPLDRAMSAALLVACGATFMTFFDLSVVNIAFPRILKQLDGATVSGTTWIVSGYAVALASTMTVAGRIADEVGRRKVFVAALGVFSLASLACGVSATLPQLIVARLAQGAAAGFMIPAALGLVLIHSSPGKTTRNLGTWAAAGGLSAVVGPAAGGLMVDSFGWRSVFLINIPVAMLLIIACKMTVPNDRGNGGGAPDPLGAVAITAGLGLTITGVTEGTHWGWISASTLVCILGGISLIVFAVIRSQGHPRPAIATQLWRSPRFAVTNAVSFLFGAGMFGWLLAGPLLLDQMWDYSINQSAGALTVGAAAAIVTSTITGRIANPTRLRPLAITGLAIFTACSLWFSSDSFGFDPNFWGAWFPAGLLGGSGMGIVVTTLSISAASSLPEREFAAGVAMNLTARQVGGALGVAALAVIFANHPTEPTVAFHQIFLVCATATIAAGVVAIALGSPSSTRPTIGDQT